MCLAISCLPLLLSGTVIKHSIQVAHHSVLHFVFIRLLKAGLLLGGLGAKSCNKMATAQLAFHSVSFRFDGWAKEEVQQSKLTNRSNKTEIQ